MIKLIHKTWWLVGITFLLSSVSLLSQNDIQAKKFERLLNLIEKQYVDTVDSEALVEAAIVGLLKELDPHSVYISKDEVKGMNEPLQGNFEGIGVQFNILDDTIIVIHPISGGPSDKLGIKSGDRIVTINDENVAGNGITNNKVRSKLMGNKGTVVNVGIKRFGSKKLLDFAITRDKIPIHSVDAAYMMDKKTGYIKLNRFSATTLKEFEEALTTLKNKGMKQLILDLEGNGGGYLNMAIELSDVFLSEGQLIVYTEGINNPKKTYNASNKGDFESGRLVLIINEGSASASEIVSGAIQDWDRGVLIGRRSFGKGLVQRQFPLTDGSAARLTIAHYYTPTGRSIQKPYNEGVESYRKDISDRYKNGELSNEDSIHFADSLKFETLSSQRTVFGGGGIMPDIFVPIDTTAYTDYYRDLVRKGILNKFVLGKIDSNRAELKMEYPDFNLFKLNFNVDSLFLNELFDMAEGEGIEKEQEEMGRSIELLRVQVKALLGRDLYEEGNYFELFNAIDPLVLKAYEVINDKKEYNDILKGKNE
ncbi:MAG: S41 family peptidase [Bacteroidales bacterium]|nr:S41 family peptidase [Bacteroidales bacterium]